MAVITQIFVAVCFISGIFSIPISNNVDKLSLYKLLADQHQNFNKVENDYEDNNYVNDPESHLSEDLQWPTSSVEFGQVTGLATDDSGDVHVFHRVNRVWTEESFDENNVFRQKELGPIVEHTLVKLNHTSGAVLEKMGDNMFYMPHGLAMDNEGNYWVTDVAMHQVLKVKPGSASPMLTIGERFVPAESNEDEERLCKPTDVALSSKGDIFVADGYCNSRVIKYDRNGKYVGHFGEGQFWVPHGIALVEDMDLVCVADRENMRVACYNAGLRQAEHFGRPERDYDDQSLGRVFGLEYNEEQGLLYGVSGPSQFDLPLGFVIDMTAETKQDYLLEWRPNQALISPHDITVNKDGSSIYIGEINPSSVRKFVRKVK